MLKFFFTLLLLVVNLYGEKSIEQVERELAFQELKIEVERLKDKAKSGDTEAELELQAKESELKIAKQRLESSSSESNSLELKAKELELKERELQLREKELDLKKREAELQNSEKPVEREKSVVKKKVKKRREDNFFSNRREVKQKKRNYIAIRHGSGSSDIVVDSDWYSYTADEVDSSATEIVYGFINSNYNRSEFGLFTNSLGDGEVPITGTGVGYRYTFTGKYEESDTIYLYYSIGLHYMGLDDYFGYEDASALGFTGELGAILEVGDGFDVSIGYESATLFYSNSSDDEDYYSDSVTILESRGLIKVGLIVKF